VTTDRFREAELQSFDNQSILEVGQNIGEGVLTTAAGAGTIYLTDQLGGQARTFGTIAGLGAMGAGLLELSNTFTGDGEVDQPDEKEANELKEDISITGFKPEPGYRQELGTIVGGTSRTIQNINAQVLNDTNQDLEGLFYGVSIRAPEGADKPGLHSFKPLRFSVNKTRSKKLQKKSGLFGNNPLSVVDILEKASEQPVTPFELLLGSLKDLKGTYEVRQSVWNKTPSPETRGLVRMADTGYYEIEVV